MNVNKYVFLFLKKKKKLGPVSLVQLVATRDKLVGYLTHNVCESSH